MKYNEKIIFLDFDDVLNTEHYQGLLQYQGKSWQDEYGAFFDPNPVKQLKRIIDATGADIVVESSWKFLGLDAMKVLWEIRSLPGKIIDITSSSVSDEHLLNIDLEIYYIVKEWKSPLGFRNTKNKMFVMSSLDDEYVILGSQLPHFILTNPYEGITEEQANKAISILNE